MTTLAFVESGELSRDLYAGAAATQKPREDADYEAKTFTDEEARATLELAERFVAAVKEIIGE